MTVSDNDVTLEYWDVRITADTSDLEEKLQSASRLGQRFSNALGSAFADVAIRGKSVGDVLKSLALNLSQLTLKAALQPLTSGVGSLLQGLVSGIVPHAKGGVISQGAPMPFANGGVISSPITFPLSGNALGLAGEKGPEAIMPLTRGSDGRLGVVAQGGGGSGITINISTPDIESFNRSQTQIAALVARAASAGQRNL